MITFVDGFDHYNDSTEFGRKGWSYTIVDGNELLFSQTPRFSGYSLGLRTTFGGGQTRTISRSLPSNEDVLYFGVAVYVVWTDDVKYFGFRDNVTDQIGIRINTDLTLSIVRNGKDGTVLATASKQMSIATWFHLASEFTIHNSAGTAKLWLNGELLLDLSGLDTQQSANAYAGKFIAQADVINNGGQADILIDDLYLGDDTGAINVTCPTEARIETLYPTSSGTYDEWSYSGTSSAWQAVDDVTPNATDYIYTSSSGTKSTFTFGDLSADADSVFALQLTHYSKKDGADIRTVIPMMGLPSGTFYNLGTGSYLGSDYQFFTYIQEVDPSTDGALDPTIVNNNEYGIIVST